MSTLNFPKINSVVISGRLTRDPDLRFTPSNVAVCNMSIAFDKSYQKNGEWINDTSYIDVVSWQKLAERCGEKLHKGSPVIVEAYLQTRQYTDKNNQNRKVVELVANRISFLEKAEEYDQATRNKVDSLTDDQIPTAKQPANNIVDDDVPF